MLINLTKEEFTNYLNRVKNAFDLDCEISKLSFSKNIELSTNLSELSTPVIELLQKIMNDKNEDISYFAWELDFGAKYEDGDFVDENDEPIDISTPEKLYDYLISVYDE